MPGMPWDDPGTGAGAAGGALTPQQQLMWRLMMSRGAGGMQPNPNTNALVNQLQGGGQQGGLMGMIMQNPQLLQWFMQQQQGGPGNFPQSGGGYQGVTLAQLLGAPQPMGQPT